MVAPKKRTKSTTATQKEEQIKSLVFQPNSEFLVFVLTWMSSWPGSLVGVNPGLLSTTVSIASASGRVRFLIRGAIASPVLYYSSMPAGDNAKNEGGLKVNYEKVVGRSPVQRSNCRVQ